MVPFYGVRRTGASGCRLLDCAAGPAMSIPPQWTADDLRAQMNAGRALPRAVIAVTALVALSGCATQPGPAGVRHREVGIASWYDPGRRTFRGVSYDSSDLTAAHRSLPFGTPVRVTNLENGRRVTVLVNDRGPFVRGRVIDVSKSAARRLGIVRSGLARVRLEAPARAPSQRWWWPFSSA
jgi:rare lipoprotein A